jgi:hypothetical protein
MSTSTIEILLTKTLVSAAHVLLLADHSSKQVILTIETQEHTKLYFSWRYHLCFMSYIYTTLIANPYHYLECSLRQTARRIPRINPIVVLFLHLRQRASGTRSPFPTGTVVSIAVRSAPFLRNSRDASERA